MAAAVENPPVSLAGESKSARKKKAKADAAAVNGTKHTVPAVPEVQAKDDSTAADAENGSAEHPYLKELQKQIRNVNKKLTALQKLDAIVAENPKASLDDLVAQKRINNDQRAAMQKKPQLLSQLADLEERQEHYRKFDADYQFKLNKQRDELAAQHRQELDKVREDLKSEAVGSSSSGLREKLLTFSQFLRAAAAKRTVEEDANTNESRAFEGALLLVYGGDQKAVDTAISLIEGSDEQVPSIEGAELPVTYAQIKQASIDHGPFQTEEAWANDVAEATSGEGHADPDLIAAGTDPTITHAGLTELEAPMHNGIGTDTVAEQASAGPVSSGDVGNLAGERWNTDAAGTSAGAEKSGLEESYEMIPRPSDEVDVPAEPATTAGQPQSTSWADEPPAYEAVGTGNKAGESWDVKAAGEEEPSGWGDSAAEAAPAGENGFQEVAGRTRGRGRGRGDGGEFRARGGRRGNFRGGRGDGESKRGSFRNSRGDGESRGGFRGGRGRGGPRGGGEAVAARS